jgi:hypothetical protein
METDEMRVVAEFASLAPSVHNTQPWRFVARNQALEVHADPGRALHYLDQGHRQMYISCGAAAEFARLAIRSLSHACTLRLLPAGGAETLVATLVIGGPEPTAPVEERMIDAVARRYTDRGPYTDEQVSRGAVQRMREAAAERHCWLRVLDRPDDRLSVIRLLSTAEAAEAEDAGYREELEAWRRSGPSDDGVPTEAFAGWDGGRVNDVPLRDFSGAADHPHPDSGVPPTVERDTIVLLGTDRDDPASWLQAGRALADVLLTITDDDLVSQPLGPVLDLPFTRAQLRRDLGLVGYPQMLLRVGHGMRAPLTGRRSVDEVFTAVPTP